MSVNITDASTFDSPLVAPASGDLVAAAAAGGLLSLQGLANRTRYLLDTLHYQVKVAQPASPSPTTSYYTMTSVLTNVTLATVTFTPLVNDVIILLAQCQFNSGGAQGVQARIRAIGSTLGTVTWGASNTLQDVTNTGHTLVHVMGIGTSLYNESTTYNLQVATTDAGACALAQNWTLMALRIKGL